MRGDIGRLDQATSVDVRQRAKKKHTGTQRKAFRDELMLQAHNMCAMHGIVDDGSKHEKANIRKEILK